MPKARRLEVEMQVFERRGLFHNQGFRSDHTGREMHRLRMFVTSEEELADGEKHVKARLHHPVVR